MKKPKRRQDFIKTPRYPGGPKALSQFIDKNRRYPQEAIEHRIEGTVRIKFGVTEDGHVVQPKVVDGLGYGCDEEAVRLVQLLKYTAVRNRGVNVIANVILNIRFRLSDVTPTTNINYNYISKPSNDKNKQSYTITIKTS